MDELNWIWIVKMQKKIFKLKHLNILYKKYLALNTFFMLSNCLRQARTKIPVFSDTSSRSFLSFELSFRPRISRQNTASKRPIHVSKIIQTFKYPISTYLTENSDIELFSQVFRRNMALMSFDFSINLEQREQKKLNIKFSVICRPDYLKLDK